MQNTYHARKAADVFHKGRSVAEILEEHRYFLQRLRVDVTADLSGADLSFVDLRGAQVGPAKLERAQLSGANLRGCNLQGSSMSGVVADQADFTAANLTAVDLRQSSLIRSSLRQVILTGANLSAADLSWCDLDSALLKRTNLAYAKLIQSRLTSAIIIGAELTGAVFAGCVFGNTTVVDSNLSDAMHLERAVHMSPSHIALDTLFASERSLPEVFLRGTGAPDAFNTYYPSLNATPLLARFQSVFISYSTKDNNFSLKFYQDLTARGIKSWIFPEDAQWGEPTWAEIDKSIKVHDRLVVVCSANSLQSTPVLREIERALVREDKEGLNVLFPTTIDDFLLKTWDHPRKTDVVNKVVGDFRRWREPRQYESALERLQRSLSKSSPCGTTIAEN